MKFSELDKSSQISTIRAELSIIIDTILEEDEASLKDLNLPQELFVEIRNKMKSFLKKDCICGMCIDITKLKLLPQEMAPIIDFVKEKVSKENY